MGAENTISWKPFTPETMPPVDNQRRFLVLIGLSRADRILGVGVRCQYNDHDPYVRMVAGAVGWCLPTAEQLEDAAWAPVEITDEAVEKLKRWKTEIEKRRMRRDGDATT